MPALEDISIIGLIIAIIFFISGFLGTILPIMPSAPLIWLGMFIYGFFVDFANFSWVFYLGQGILTLLVLFVDYISSAWGVRHYGGSKAAIWGSIIGALSGIFFGPLGLIIGPFIGAVLAELLVKRNLAHAFRIGIGTLIGFLGGTVVKFVIEGIMITWFFVRIFT